MNSFNSVYLLLTVPDPVVIIKAPVAYITVRNPLWRKDFELGENHSG